MAKRKRILSKRSCLQLDECFKSKVILNDDPKFGHIEGWKAKDLPLSQSCLDELKNVRQKPKITVITVSNEKGLYVIHCPHPPCW